MALMQDSIEDFLLHLATERGLSVNYQMLVRRLDEPEQPKDTEALQ